MSLALLRRGAAKPRKMQLTASLTRRRLQGAAGTHLQHQHPPDALLVQVSAPAHVARQRHRQQCVDQRIHRAAGPAGLHIDQGGRPIASLTRGLSNQYVGRGIRVGAVAPGPVWTPLIPATMNDKAQKEFTSPMGRPAQPGDVATWRRGDVRGGVFGGSGQRTAAA